MNTLAKIALFIIASIIAAAAVDISLIIQFSLITYIVTLIVYFLCGLIFNRKFFKYYIYLFLLPLFILNILALAVNPQTFPIFSPITFIFATLAFILGEVAKKKNEKSKRPFVFYLILLGTISSFLFITFYYTPHLLFNRNREKISPSSSVYDKLNFSNLNDTPFDKNRLRNKILFIDNWFLSCYQCNLKLPSLQALYEKIQSDSTILILSVINGNIDSLNKVVEFVNKNKEFKFQILYDKENSLGKLIKVDGYPIELIIDKSGFMRERHDGFNKDERLIYVNETLKKIVSFK